MTTMTEYVETKGITVEILRDRGMQVDKDKWEHHAYVLQLTNASNGATLETPWMQGQGISESPIDRPDTILDSLASDASLYLDARDFEDFAESLGYDTDSRKAERIYNDCGAMSRRLVDFLGSQEEVNHLLYEVERL